MSSAEFAEWQAFDKAYGLPDAFTLAALVCSTLERLLSEKPRDAGQIVPYFGDAAGGGGQSPADMLARVQTMARMMAGKKQ